MRSFTDLLSWVRCHNPQLQLWRQKHSFLLLLLLN
jgi:hypothetical protein